MLVGQVISTELALDVRKSEKSELKRSFGRLLELMLNWGNGGQIYKKFALTDSCDRLGNIFKIGHSFE